MAAVQELQCWYQSHCNGDWEHSHGICIDTLDNPGWSVTIDLEGTDVAARPFQEVKRLGSETTWIHCQVIEGKFQGHGGPLMLDEILQTFLGWAAQ